MDGIVLPLASKLHGKEYYTSIYISMRKCLEEFEGLDFYPEIITKPIELDLCEYKYLVLVHLTGGTSGLAKQIVLKNGKPAILIAHGKHNSLASALSARAFLNNRGLKTRIVYVSEPGLLCRSFAPIYRGIEAALLLSGLHVLEINKDGELSSSAKEFMKATGARVEAVSFEEVREIGWSSDVTSSDLDSLILNVRRYIDLSGVDKDILYDAVRVYYALRKLVIDKGFNAISFECFPFIVKYRLTPCLAVAMMNNDGIPTACENDFYSLAILAVSFALTGKPGWIANPSGFTSEGYVRLAHCTIAPLLGGDCYLVPHFETGNPYAVTCRLSHDKVVLLRLSLDYRRINAYKAKVVESGLLEPGYCRTQAILDLGPMNGIRFLETAAGNHHVVIPWNPGLIESLKTMAWWLGWDLKIYN